MARDAQAIRARLLRAATEEFATYGNAGARVDRIADNAQTNKRFMYVYFGNKKGLYDAVVDAQVARWLEEVPLDTSDLPGYVGQLFVT
jgi:AcrR family transcriptional regulator